MREHEDRTTIVTDSGGGAGAGMIAGIVLAIAAVIVVVFLFGGSFFGADVDGGMTSSVTEATPDVNIQAPSVETPDVDINVPSGGAAPAGGGAAGTGQ